jgi:HEAT repeat protein
MELAKIADGEKPRRDLLPVLSTGREAESLEWMKELLYGDFDFRDLPLVARALGAFGVYVPEMAAPLRSTFASEREHINLRDEAFLYLALIGTSDVIKAFIEAADTEPIDEDDYVYSRGLFGLLFVDDVDVLYRQIRKNLPHSDINAYAFGLGGSRDPRGAVLLKQLENDPNEKIRKAVSKVSQCSWMSV